MKIAGGSCCWKLHDGVNGVNSGIVWQLLFDTHLFLFVGTTSIFRQCCCGWDYP